MSAAATEKRVQRQPARRPGRAAPRIDSRAKGAGGEREFAGLVFDLLGVKLERQLDQCRGGGHDLDPVGEDPAAQAMRRFAIECKRHSTATPANLAGWWAQAGAQARRVARMPALAYRPDRQPWRVLVPLRALSVAFGDWPGLEWAAALSPEAFCAPVREAAGAGRQFDHDGNGAAHGGHPAGSGLEPLAASSADHERKTCARQSTAQAAGLGEGPKRKTGASPAAAKGGLRHG